MTYRNFVNNVQDQFFKTYFNNCWTKTNIVYEALPNKFVIINDIFNWDSEEKTKIISGHFIVMDILENLDSDDKKVLYAFNWVKDNIIYVGDFKTHKTQEYWQTPHETFQTEKGDCEDGAILMYKICRILGVPEWKLKLRVQKVKYNGVVAGHCFLAYLTKGIKQFAPEWYSLDWCYMPSESLNNFRLKPIRFVEMYNPSEQLSEYNPFKWSFNELYMWSQETWEVPWMPELVKSEDIIL